MTSGEALRVGVVGETGRLGSLAAHAIAQAPDLQLSAGLSGRGTLDELVATGTEVMLDVTHPDVVMDHVAFALDHGMHCVVGTSGVAGDRLDTIRGWLVGHPELGVLVAPSFAIGAVLADRFARQAARFFASAEVVELHHAGKADAPSGTAVAAARTIGEARSAAGLGDVPDATGREVPGARGAVLDGVHVHSVRLPGMVAHLQILLGNEGETLTIRHDSTSRESFMPGMLLALRAVRSRPGLTVGLGALLDS